MQNTPDKKKIYIVVSKTNTFMGACIRFFTRYEYNHVSIALEKELQPMYSFSRYNINAPMVGGFVEESWLRYLYNDKNVKVKLYCIEISDENYQAIENEIREMSNTEKKLIYDTFGVLHGVDASTESKQKYTCLSFAGKILYRAQILPKQKPVKNIRQLCKVLEPYFVEERVLSKTDKEKYSWNNDKYYEKKAITYVCMATVVQLVRAFIE